MRLLDAKMGQQPGGIVSQIAERVGQLRAASGQACGRHPQHIRRRHIMKACAKTDIAIVKSNNPQPVFNQGVQQ